jgi:short-subunit dehydrogenase
MNTSSSKQYAVVTGGSSGIGLEIAKQFAQNGFDLLIAAEDAGLAGAAREIEALGASVEAVQVDLATPAGVEELSEAIASGGRAVDAIAINAGVGVGGRFLETPLDEELRLIDLNVRSTVHLAKRALPAMVARGAGRVLITSSIAALMAAPYESVYAASKAFGKSFAASLRNELKDSGVTITTLMPGPTDTNFFHRADMDDTKVGADDKKADPAQVAKQAYEALIGGKHEVIAGPITTKFEGVMAKVSPEEVTAGRHGKLAEPGSANES